MTKRNRYLDHLAQVPMFSACTQRELQLIARAADEVQLPEGYVLVQQGGAAREFFVIVDGKASVTRDGREVAMLGPGEFFGELGLLERAPRNASVTTTTPATVMVLGAQRFTALLAEAPTLARKLMVGMARRLSALDATS